MKYYLFAGFRCQCAVDVFMHQMTQLNKIGDNFVGVSNGKEFNLNGVSSFRWGKRKSHHRQPTVKVDLPYKGSLSSVSLESLWAFLDEAYTMGSVRSTYIDLVGNCKGNQVAQGLPLDSCDIEIVTKSQNSAHGQWWHKCLRAGVRTQFSAIDYKFRAYLEACQGGLTPGYIQAYSGIHPVIKHGITYWEV